MLAYIVLLPNYLRSGLEFMFYVLNNISGTLRITKKTGKRYGPSLMSVTKDGEQHLVLRTGHTPPMRRE